MIMFTLVSYPAKGLRLDINNGPYDDSNRAHLLAPAFFQLQLE